MNELTKRICEKMGISTSGTGKNFDFRTSPALADLLENKMVADGWRITVQHWLGDDGATMNVVNALAIHERFERIEIDEFATTRPLAITELFCRVYEIPWEAV